VLALSRSNSRRTAPFGSMTDSVIPVVQMDQQRFAGPLRRGAGRLIEAQQHPRAALDAHDPVESAVAAMSVALLDHGETFRAWAPPRFARPGPGDGSNGSP